MKLTLPFIAIAILSALSCNGRVVQQSQAPYGRRQLFSTIAEEPTGDRAIKSAIHNRVARHIRPDFNNVLQRRQVLGPADDEGGITNFKGNSPQPIRGKKGSPFLHESNTAIDKQNVDYVSPPPTDNGVIPNLKWSFSLSKTKLLKGGWVREQVVTDLPVSKDVAAAEQSLSPFAYRELHWHRVAEWAFVINGST